MPDGFEFDLSDVFSGIDFVSDRVREGAERGMNRAMQDLLDESRKEAPRLSGELRSKAHFDVKVGRGFVTGTVTYLAIATSKTGWAFNYALRLHEYPGQFKHPTTPGTGPKFLSRPLKARKGTYEQWIAEEIRKELT